MTTKRNRKSSMSFCSLTASTLFLVLLGFTSCNQSVKITSTIRANKKITKDIELNTKLNILSSNNKKVNTELATFNTLRTKEVKKTADALRKEATTTFKELEQSKAGRPSWKYSYIVKDAIINLNPKGVISILQAESSFAGGAHPNTIYKAYNYDLKSHKLLTKKDIIKATNAKALNTILYTTFQKQNSAKIELLNKPTLAITDAICLTNDQVIFVYNPYTLAPYSNGVIKIKVNKALISKYVAY